MSSNGNVNKKDKDRTFGQKTGNAIDSSVSWLDNAWDKHATKVVLVILLLILVWYYRKNISDSISEGVEVAKSAASSVGSAAKSAASSVGSAASSLGATIGLSSDGPGASRGGLENMSVQVPRDIGTGAGVPTASEIRALFNF